MTQGEKYQNNSPFWAVSVGFAYKELWKMPERRHDRCIIINEYTKRHNKFSYFSGFVVPFKGLKNKGLQPLAMD